MEFNGDINFFCFRQEISFFDKFCPNNQSYLYKLKFGNKCNSSMLNLKVVMLTFFLRPEPPFLSKSGPKIQIRLLKVKFEIKYILNSMMVFIFSVLDCKYPFWKNWFQIIKVVICVCLICLTLLCPVFVLTN